MASLDGLLFALTFAATLGCGLMAGLFFAFSVAVMKALERLPPAEGIVRPIGRNAAETFVWILSDWLWKVIHPKK
jgi:hypothetical protein